MRQKPCTVMGDRAKRRWRPSPRGVGRDETRVRGPGGSGETELAFEAKGVGRAVVWTRGRGARRAGTRALVITGGLLCLLRFFIALIWVSLFMVPNTSPRAFGAVKAPFQRFFSNGLFDLEPFYFLWRVRASAPAGSSPRAFWRNGVIPSKAFTPECCSGEY